MAKELPIIDAEFEDITNYGPSNKSYRSNAKVKALSKPSPSIKKPRAKSNTQKKEVREGRLDVLCGGILQAIYYNSFGSCSPEISNAIKKGATAIVGRQRAKGPEFEFLKALLS